MVTFKPEATEAERQTVREAIDGFASAIPEVRSIVAGANVGKGPNHHDYVMVADFDDMDAFRRYIASPAHQAYVAGPAKAVERIAAIQHEW
jgi:quinol monooxygenase YgiN